ncbi:MAG: hypothetical protein AB9873_13475 [Syntrophobacteraceae bacterium]
MTSILHITSGDVAGNLLAKSGLPGEILVWHDVLYDGFRKPGWPDQDTLESRAQFLEGVTAGGLSKDFILETLKAQYQRLESHDGGMTLWFDACLFDQAMLCHILACLQFLGNQAAELICIRAFPGIEPFHGLGQLQPEDFVSLHHRRQPVTDDQFHFAGYVDQGFALQDRKMFVEISQLGKAPLPWVPPAVTRWLQELPDEATGLGRLEQLALEAIRSGCHTPAEILARASANEIPPQFWGDITLWAKINSLADRNLLQIEGPAERLPQWEGIADLKLFRVTIPQALEELATGGSKPGP